MALSQPPNSIFPDKVVSPNIDYDAVRALLAKDPTPEVMTELGELFEEYQGNRSRCS